MNDGPSAVFWILLIAAVATFGLWDEIKLWARLKRSERATQQVTRANSIARRLAIVLAVAGPAIFALGLLLRELRVLSSYQQEKWLTTGACMVGAAVALWFLWAPAARLARWIISGQARRSDPTPNLAGAAPPPLAKPSGKYDFGIHISELSIAIEAHKNYAEKCKLFVPIQGNGRSLNWNCCASVYASIRLAALKAQTKIHRGVWNTIVFGMVNRMITDEIDGIGRSHPQFAELEAEAYGEIERINRAVDDALDGKGEFLVQPIAKLLITGFGATDAKSFEAMSAMIVMNAETAQTKILPEILADLQ